MKNGVARLGKKGEAVNPIVSWKFKLMGPNVN
jgi:hypothetical protein